MSPLRNRTLAVLAASAVLVGGANLAAYAANGQPLLLGKNNGATKTTTISNTKGTALKLKSKKGKAPFKVSNTEKVKKLNADLLDGLDSSALQTKSYVYSLTGSAAVPDIDFAFTGLPAGKYLVSYNLGANVTGAPTYFGCYLTASPVGPNHLAQLGVLSGGWYLSSSGYLDTTAGGTYLLHCTTNGTGISVPASGAAPGHIVFSRVDDATSGSSTGSRSNYHGAFAR